MAGTAGAGGTKDNDPGRVLDDGLRDCLVKSEGIGSGGLGGGILGSALGLLSALILDLAAGAEGAALLATHRPSARLGREPAETLGQEVEDPAEEILEVLGRHDEGLAGQRDETRDSGGLGRLTGRNVDGERATGVGEDDRTLEQGDDAAVAIDVDVPRYLGAADADGRHRRVDNDVLGMSVRDLAGNEGKGALKDGERRAPLLGVGVEDQVVEHHARVLVQREGGVVDEDDAEGRPGPGLHHVAREDGIAFRQAFLGALGAGDENLARDALDVTDWIRRQPLFLFFYPGQARGRQRRPRAMCRFLTVTPGAIVNRAQTFGHHAYG